MIADPIFYAGGGLTVVLGIATLVLVQRDYRQRETLSKLTVATVWLAYVLHLSITVLAAIDRTWLLPISNVISVSAGILLMTSGTFMFATALWAFNSLKRMSGRDTSKLITSGIYRWSRNPQNVGWTMFLLGISLLGQSCLAVAMTALFAFLFVVYAPMEESYLEQTFGDEYRAYKNRSHRYFGPPRTHSAG